jgi:site-specific recombinase XerD
VSEIETKMDAAGAGEKVLYLGDAVEFFLNAKRAGGRSEKTTLDYRKKLDLFQRWISGEEFDVPLSRADADAIEAYVVYPKDTRRMADSSRRNHLDVLRSFFKRFPRGSRSPASPERS